MWKEVVGQLVSYFTMPLLMICTILAVGIVVILQTFTGPLESDKVVLASIAGILLFELTLVAVVKATRAKLKPKEVKE